MEVTTYELIPGITPGEIRTGSGAEMFSVMVNKWVRGKKKALTQKGVDISLFFNHDLETGKTIIGYPKVIYHHFNGRFYLTGVNEGAQAVQMLAAAFGKPFEENGMVFAGFKPVAEAKNEGTIHPGKVFGYRLENWIPFHHKDFGAFGQLPLTGKAMQLNHKLRKHIGGELCLYLGIETKGLEAEITGILLTHPKPFYYKKNLYYMFDIEFISNIKLPRFITLGNIKSLGFGRVEPM